MWQPIATAPFLIDASGERIAIVFPCRRMIDGWMNAKTKKRVEVYPTHWREWKTEH
jgi:hypothetical protein